MNQSKKEAYPPLHFPKFISKKIVVQLKKNGPQLFYRSEMEISFFIARIFASYEQKTILACKSWYPEVHCQKICATKSI